MRKATSAFAVLLMSVTGLVVAGTGTAASAAESGQGVTAGTIKVGVTYPDVAAIKNLINVDPGNYQVAYTALFNQINAKGGIDGRKISPVFAAVDPLGTAGAATACTQLTEDDKVFAVLGFFQAVDTACYLTTHTTPIVGVFAHGAAVGRRQGPLVQLPDLRQRPDPQGDGHLQGGGCLHRQEGRRGRDVGRLQRDEPGGPGPQEAQDQRGPDRGQLGPRHRHHGSGRRLSDHRSEVPVLWRQRGHCRRQCRERMARRAAGQPEHLHAADHRHRLQRPRCLRGQQGRRHPVHHQERADGGADAAGHGRVERPGHEELRGHRQEGRTRARPSAIRSPQRHRPPSPTPRR